IQETIKKMEARNSGDAFMKSVVNEMCLQGDPVLKFNSWDKPDLAAKDENIYFSPSTVSSQTDTFSIHFVTRNLAKAIPDTFPVRIKRTLPDGTDSIYTIFRTRCYYGDTMTLTMRAGALKG